MSRTLCRFAWSVALIVLALPEWGGAAELDRYLPDDTDMVASINVRQVIDSPVFQNYARDPLTAWLKTTPIPSVLGLVGLDPWKDVQRITLAGPGSNAVLDRWMAIGHGQFDRDRIERAADLLTRVDTTILKIHKDAPGAWWYEIHLKNYAHTLYAAFPDKQSVVVSTVPEWVHDALAEGQGNKEASVNPDVKALVAKQNDQQSIWLTGVPLDLVQKELANNPRLQAMAANVESFSGSVVLTTALRIELRIQTDNPRSGLRLRRFLELENAVAVLALRNNENLQDVAPLLVGVLTSLRMTQDGGTVVLGATIPPHLIERWVQKEGFNRPPAPAPAPESLPAPKAGGTPP